MGMCRSVTANAGTPGESEPQTVWARASKQCQQQATRSADLVFLCSGLRPDTDTDTDADTDTDTASPDGRVSGQTDTLCPRRPPPVEFWHRHTLSTPTPPGLSFGTDRHTVHTDPPVEFWDRHALSTPTPPVEIRDRQTHRPQHRPPGRVSGQTHTHSIIIWGRS